MHQTLDKEVNDITNINALSHSFDFLNDEPEIYSLADLNSSSRLPHHFDS